MKKISYHLLIIILFASLFACNQQGTNDNLKSQETDVSKVEVETVINKWLNFWETYDLNMLDEIFLQSDELTYFSSEKEGLMKGYDQLMPHHVSFGFVEGGKKPEKALWLENVDTRLYGETAMVAAIWYFGSKEASKDSVQRGPVSFVIVNDDKAKAKIVHTHFANY